MKSHGLHEWAHNPESNMTNKLRTWYFYRCLVGTGTDIEEAYQDANEQFHNDPGDVPGLRLTAEEHTRLQRKLYRAGHVLPCAAETIDEEDP